MRGRTKSRAGFTLLELLIGSTLAGVVMVGMFSGFLFIGRNLSRLASYQALESESRKALAYLRRDFALAERVKNGTTPSASSVTLVLPSGEITYTYDSAARRLRRQASFGPATEIFLLQNSLSECTTFAFRYFTTADAAPTDQLSPAVNVPYSIKQIEAWFIVESPSSWSAQRRTRYEAASSRFLLRNRGAPDGT